VIRLFLLSHHYRSPLDYSEDSLIEAKMGLDRFYIMLEGIQEELNKPVVPSPPTLPSPSRGEGIGGGSATIENCHKNIESFQTRFEEAMDDDFNTAQALGYFYDLQRHLNSLLDISKGHPTEEITSMLKQGSDHFPNLGWIFGLFQENPETYLSEQRKEGLNKLKLSEEEILRLIEERNLARREKNWKRADEIRNQLLSKGIVLEDTPSGTIWKIK
jgi:cysteinyl-tRNA synthetase